MNNFKMNFPSFCNYFLFSVFLISTFYDSNLGAVVSPTFPEPEIVKEFMKNVIMNSTGKLHVDRNLSFKKTRILRPSDQPTPSDISSTTPERRERINLPEPKKEDSRVNTLPFMMEFNDKEMQRMWFDVFDLSEDPSFTCKSQRITINLSISTTPFSTIAEAFHCDKENDRPTSIVEKVQNEIYLINGYVKNSVITVKKIFDTPRNRDSNSVVVEGANEEIHEPQALWHLSPEREVDEAKKLWDEFLSKFKPETGSSSQSKRSISEVQFTTNKTIFFSMKDSLCELLLVKRYTTNDRFIGIERKKSAPLPEFLSVLSKKEIPLLVCTVIEHENFQSHNYYVIQSEEFSVFIVDAQSTEADIKVEYAKSVGPLDPYLEVFILTQKAQAGVEKPNVELLV